MRKGLIILGFFLVQFCVKAQNWTNVGYIGEVYPNTKTFCPDTVNNRLFLLGFITVDSVTSQTGIAELINGNDWQYPSFTQVGSPTRSLIFFQGSYYACPLLSTSGVAKWTGSNWDDVGDANGGAVFKLYNDGDSILWALGSFSSIGSVTASGIAKFDGVTWSALDTITWDGGIISSMCRYNGDIYFGGNQISYFQDLWRIARWDGTQWYQVGNGIRGNIEFVQDMTVYNNELYIGGWFWAGVNGNPGDMIAKWDGTQWYQVGGGMQNGQVNDFEIYNGKLWAAGAFINAGGTTASMVATYDGLDWCDVGTFDISVSDLCVFNNELYLCGNFQTIDGDSVAHTVKWIGGGNNNGCGHLNTAINEESVEAFVQVFPNPVIDKAIFNFSGTGSYTTIIFDQFGREIWRKESNESQLEFSTDGFAPGLYYFRVDGLIGSGYSGKLVIQ